MNEIEEVKKRLNLLLVRLYTKRIIDKEDLDDLTRDLK